MAKVSNLTIKPQKGNPGTYFASWSFNETTSTTTSGVKKGDLVSIKPGSKYYNGVAIPSWVMNQKWYITQVKGDRAVLGKNASGSNDINSPINVNDLPGGSSSSTTVTTNNLDHYSVEWFYDSGDGWFSAGSASDTTEKVITYSPPDYAVRIKVTVKPVAKTYKQGDADVPYWQGTVSEYPITLDEIAPPEVPSGLSASIDENNKFKLDMRIENISDPRTDAIQFEVTNGTTVVYTSPDCTVVTCMASATYNVVAGGEYRVRCRSININGSGNVYSEWSAYTNTINTIPATPSGITELRATSETSIYIAWEATNAAKTYDIEYATKKTYFDGSDQTTVISDIEFTHYEKSGLESGQEYFFRVRAANDGGRTAWSESTSIVIGKKPGVPTTWSSTTTAVVGEPLNLYWVHNSEDNSSETKAEIEIYIDGVKETIPIKNEETDEDLKDRTKVYPIDTSKFAEGTQIQWRVRTAGVTSQYGDWSIQRVVDVYAPPVLTLNVTDLEGNAVTTLTQFPFYIYALAGPKTQAPIGYHVTITSNEIYETTDNVGNVKMVNAGEAVYSKYFDITSSLGLEMTPAVINLDNGISYTVTCIVSMNSGLTAESTAGFTVDWVDDIYYPNAEITIDPNTLAAHIRPYCEEATITYYKVTKSGSKYTKTDTVVEGITNGELVVGARTTTGEDVFTGVSTDGSTIYYCEIETRSLVDGITLSLYRREFNGEFVELATRLRNTDRTFVTDPHPALDYARYRVVAVSESTGAISFYDLPGYPTGVTDIVVQWEEAWTNFDSFNGDVTEQPPWSGSMIRLPYNIDVSESTSPDVTLVNYSGRSNPVSYYGTQIGSTATWNTEIVADDKETIYALRRLQHWMGDVYVREPSGSGYWANITVQFSQKHGELTIPVTLTITRVEGGI